MGPFLTCPTRPRFPPLSLHPAASEPFIGPLARRCSDAQARRSGRAWCRNHRPAVMNRCASVYVLFRHTARGSRRHYATTLPRGRLPPSSPLTPPRRGASGVPTAALRVSPARRGEPPGAPVIVLVTTARSPTRSCHDEIGKCAAGSRSSRRGELNAVACRRGGGGIDARLPARRPRIHHCSQRAAVGPRVRR